MRIPFLRPKAEEPAAATPPKPKRSRAAKAGPVVDDVVDVQTARTQARRRLIGAVVLLAIGVIGFPVLFETQPRPLPLDTPMEPVRRDAAVGGLVAREVVPSPRNLPVTMPPADAGNEVALPASAAASLPAVAPASAARPVTPAAASGVVKVASAAAAPAVAPAPVPAAVPAPAPASAAKPAVPKPPPATAPAPTSGAAAPAKAASVAASPATEAVPTDAAPSRFVVQAGAYKESGKLREARSKIEGLGYKTYTQVVENENGSRTRVRVGPYATHQEAEAVAAKLKKNGLPAAIVKL